MTDTEFWASTCAKVMALKDLQDEKDKRRDYFTALSASTQFKDMTANDILAHRYGRTEAVEPEPDLDLGADVGTTLRYQLKERTEHASY